ncbi:type III-D CRISPR-associated protein Csx19 [Chloroflexus aggregans]|uniref:Uncharacterized protein n=1 Tax=Chloroflexus aggregans (strain MD-66 / DSM 9485) TaxID=326427 RepID=B8G726_CHLAD|nr:CRISPR-associated protein Csx19 [Chloroflexus aggregans]ACL23983.1 conserved hypothetical protein [Chloroflexus aggregans DSM 9485]
MSDESNDFFTQLYEKMQKANLSNSDRPAILGGECMPDQLQAFLTAWQGHWQAMPYRIWEHVSHIEFADLPTQPEFLERAEIFGELGHLSLRRDGNRWLWHYIGTSVSFTSFGARDFWKEHPDCQLRRYAESVMLWGERKDHQPRWFEDRVAAAILAYPLNATGRVYLHFWRYTEQGRTAFVWYRALSDRPDKVETQ